MVLPGGKESLIIRSNISIQSTGVTDRNMELPLNHYTMLAQCCTL